MKWKLAKAVMAGRIHRSHHTESQDAVAWLPLANDIVGATMADGAGSASCAVEGARFAAMTARDMLAEAVTDVFTWPEDRVARWLLDGIVERLRQKAGDKGTSLDDYACTLLFIVSDGRQVLCGNLGDGCVACHTAATDTSPAAATLLLPPEHGQYKNESFFVTTPGIYKHFRIRRMPYQPGSVYALMTDGTCECLLYSREQTFAPAFATMAGWMRHYTYDQVEEALLRNMHSLFTQRTTDDCAIAFVSADE